MNLTRILAVSKMALCALLIPGLQAGEAMGGNENMVKGVAGIPDDSATNYRIVKGRVYEDADGDGRVGPGDTGLSGVAVSDGLGTCATGADGRFELNCDTTLKDTYVFVETLSGYKPGKKGFFRRVSEIKDGEELEFPLDKAPERAGKNVSFVHVSDLHVGTDAYRLDELSTVLNDISVLKPAFVVATGDLADENKRPEFLDYAAAVAKSPVPVYSCAGNHDNTFDRYLGPSYYAFEAAQCRFIILNSSLLGKPAERQAAWLEKDLAAQPEGKSIFVFWHIPPENKNPLPGKNKSLKDLLAAHKVKAVFFGHWHASKIYRDESGIINVSTPPPCMTDMVVGPRGFTLATVKNGEATFDFRYAGCRKALTIVHPADGAEVVQGPIDIAVNAYDSSSPAPVVKCKIDSGDWQETRQTGKMGWSVVADLKPGKHSLAVRVTWQDGQTKEAVVSFTVTEKPSPVPISGQEWPMFKHDPKRSGASADKVAPPLRLAWMTNLGGASMMSSPVIAGDTVYMGLADEDLSGKAGVYALDAKTGAKKWFSPSGTSIKHTVAVDGGLVFAVEATGRIMAINTADGSINWDFRDKRADADVCWAFSSPLVANGVVYADNGRRSNLMAFEAATGKMLWDTKKKWGAGANSASAADGGDRIVVPSLRGSGIWTQDKNTGAELWLQKAHMFNLATPVVSQESGMVYQICTDLGGPGSLFAMKLDSGETVWTFPFEKRWPRRLPCSSPALSGGKLFFGASDGTLRCIDATTGKEVWTLPMTPASASMAAYFQDDNPVISSPAVSGDSVVYVGDLGGFLWAVDAKEGKELWKYNLGAPIISSPAISGNTVYISALDGSIFAFTTK